MHLWKQNSMKEVILAICAHEKPSYTAREKTAREKFNWCLVQERRQKLSELEKKAFRFLVFTTVYKSEFHLQNLVSLTEFKALVNTVESLPSMCKCFIIWISINVTHLCVAAVLTKSFLIVMGITWFIKRLNNKVTLSTWHTVAAVMPLGMWSTVHFTSILGFVYT